MPTMLANGVASPLSGDICGWKYTVDRPAESSSLRR